MLRWLIKNKFWRDVRGVSVVEFALILPVMLVMIFGTVEISNLMIADRKLVSATSTTADLFAQTKSVTDDEIADIFRAGSAIMQPLELSSLSFVVSSVVADAGGVTRVDWSEGYGAAGMAAGSIYELPPGLIAANQSVIVVQSQYNYVSQLGQMIVAPIGLTDRFFLAPRRSVKVTHL
ncbi:MAG: pilus assembly protein [Alphaproteobacteria bacterium]|nr:pilus assembly protein [Alphaproteobacteria bacterium]